MSALFQDQMVSIHASHAGGDAMTPSVLHAPDVSIHASHAGGDIDQASSTRTVSAFQSTPPMREATHASYELPHTR